MPTSLETTDNCLPVSPHSRRRGDWKCGSGECDTVKNARVEIAGVEKAGVD